MPVSNMIQVIQNIVLGVDSTGKRSSNEQSVIPVLGSRATFLLRDESTQDKTDVELMQEILQDIPLLDEVSYDSTCSSYENIEKWVQNSNNSLQKEWLYTSLRKKYQNYYTGKGDTAAGDRQELLGSVFPYLCGSYQMCILLAIDSICHEFLDAFKKSIPSPFCIPDDLEIDVSPNSTCLRLVCVTTVPKKERLRSPTEMGNTLCQAFRSFGEPADLHSSSFLFIGVTETEFQLFERVLQQLQAERKVIGVGYTSCYCIGCDTFGVRTVFEKTKTLQYVPGELQEVLRELRDGLRPKNDQRPCLAAECGNTQRCGIGSQDLTSYLPTTPPMDWDEPICSTKYLNILPLPHDDAQEIYLRLDQPHRLACAYIFGESGTGKSRMAYHYFDLHRRDPDWQVYYYGCPAYAVRQLMVLNENYNRRYLVIVDNILLNKTQHAACKAFYDKSHPQMIQGLGLEELLEKACVHGNLFRFLFVINGCCPLDCLPRDALPPGVSFPIELPAWKPLLLIRLAQNFIEHLQNVFRKYGSIPVQTVYDYVKKKIECNELTTPKMVIDEIISFCDQVDTSWTANWPLILNRPWEQRHQMLLEQGIQEAIHSEYESMEKNPEKLVNDYTHLRENRDCSDLEQARSVNDSTINSPKESDSKNLGKYSDDLGGMEERSNGEE